MGFMSTLLATLFCAVVQIAHRSLVECRVSFRNPTGGALGDPQPMSSIVRKSVRRIRLITPQSPSEVIGKRRPGLQRMRSAIGCGLRELGLAVLLPLSTLVDVCG